MARKKSLEEEQLTDTSYYILLAMTKPIHGYGIMQRVREISEGTFEIGPSSLYTSLKKMLDVGLIYLINTDENDKKTYSLTDEGIKFLSNDFKRRKKMMECGKKILEDKNEEITQDNARLRFGHIGE